VNELAVELALHVADLQRRHNELAEQLAQIAEEQVRTRRELREAVDAGRLPRDDTAELDRRRALLARAKSKHASTLAILADDDGPADRRPPW